MRFLLYSSALVIVFSSCNIINPDEDIPGYVTINSVSLQTAGNEGTASNNITETWLFVNDNMNGAFSLPATVPILSSGPTKIACYGGIKNNGIGSLRIRYPFYAPYDTVVNIQPNQQISIDADLRYVAGLDIDASRNFESLLDFEEVGTTANTFEITVDASLVLEGNGAGVVTMAANQNYLQFVDNDPFTFTAGNTAFLEMNYSCNNSFTVGCYAIDAAGINQVGIVTMTPTTSDALLPTWNKIYLDLGAIGLLYPGTDYYKIYIESVRYEASNPKIYLDNLKLVKYQE